MNNNRIIYFDNASTTKVDPIVLECFNQAHQDYFANPSSIHRIGQEANHVLFRCKEDTLRLYNLNEHQIIYLSGATEANNLAIKGAAFRYKNRGRHLITTTFEHPSVLEAFKQLEKEFGFEVTYLNPNKDGVIEIGELENAIRKDTILVSIMAVNNEIGAINPIEQIAILLTKYPKVLFHVDACQAIGKLDRAINFCKVDLVTVSAHKIHGMVGFGALLKKKNLELLPILSGGGQEYDLRSGTNDLPSALAFKKTLELALTNQKERYEYVSKLADKLFKYLNAHEDLFELNLPNPVNPYIINFSSLTKKGSVIVEALSNQGIMVSSVSACHSSKEKKSYVVEALGKSDKVSNNTIRVSLDYTNTLEEMDYFLSILDKIVGEIR